MIKFRGLLKYSLIYFEQLIDLCIIKNDHNNSNKRNHRKHSNV